MNQTVNVFDTLMERGFIQQCTHEDEVRALLGKERVTFYTGFDPTADSLTIGHFLPIMAMMHMQRAGHRPIAVVGGGTGMVGDPTDRTEMRKIFSMEQVNHNVECFKAQLATLLKFGGDEGVLVNNADWLLKLQYIDFIREYGVHFSVNKMLTADAYKTRLEAGLTFFEFNYMLMQSYDFLELYRKYNCKMQFGGNDQWSNIIGGVELIRRVENGSAYGLTFTLLTTSEGVKMGKSQKGAVWLDPDKTSPYDFFQYLRNVDDADVKKMLLLLTFLPVTEINAMCDEGGSALNKAKETLAYETTKIVHGEDAAEAARSAARALFAPGEDGGGSDAVPTTEITAADFGDGMNIVELLELTKLIPSRAEGRRLLAQGGIKAGGEKVDSFDHIVKPADFSDKGTLLLQKGKKVYHRIRLI